MLPLEPIVEVVVNLTANNVASGVFDVGAILAPTDTNTASVAGTLATFTSLSEAISALTTAGYVATDDVYKDVVSYFGVDPAPAKLLVYYYSTANSATVVDALAALLDKTVDFYGLVASGVTTKATVLALDAAVRASSHPMMYFTPISGSVSSAVAAGSTLSDLYALSTRRTMVFYGDAAALMGLAMGLERTHQTSSFALCYKSIMGATPSASLTSSEIASIEALNGNVYITRGKDSKVLEKGATVAGARYDEVMYVDQIANQLQTAMLNMIVGSDVKLPQADSTTTMFVSECNRILEQYYNRGILATLPWRGADIGTVANGDILEHGYCCMADSFDVQSAADRAAHKAMPITILLCLSGAVESVRITLNVQQ